MDNEILNRAYEAWMAAESHEQAALLLHQAYGTVESLALYEQAVENAEQARTAYHELVAAAAPQAALSRVEAV